MSDRLHHLRRWLGVSALIMLLSGCESTASRGLQAIRLPACSAEGSVFAEKPFDEWANLYHDNVDKVIEAHLKTTQNLGNQPLKCTEKDYTSLIPPSAPLKEVAKMLPAWKNRLSDLHEPDMQAVLLEFLRVYECSMDEDVLFLPVVLTKDTSLDRGDYNDQMTKIRESVDREKIISRETLDRTLGIVSGFDRLQPLSVDIECLKRSSLDLRNALGLASDVSSCLPRIWDAKGSLRDLAQ